MAFFGREATPIIEAAALARHNAEHRADLMEHAPPPRHPSAPKRLMPLIDCDVMDEAAIAEYRGVANEIGMPSEDLLVEEFRIFLARHDIPTFNIQEVVTYMDGVAAKDNPAGLGWHWCPLRTKDVAVAPMRFGKPAERKIHETIDGSGNRSANTTTKRASDYYESHRFAMLEERSRHPYLQQVDWNEHLSSAYSHVVPLHALKKVMLIEREFGPGKAAFLVSDYTLVPHKESYMTTDLRPNPDPFLMAVIPNRGVAHGKGRFIIDVWDEPGFGIAQMVK